MAETWKKICAGRFNLLVPANFRMHWNGQNFDGATIEPLGSGNERNAEQAAARRADAIRAGRVASPAGRAYQLRGVGRDGNTTIVDYETSRAGSSSFVRDIFVARHGAMWRISGPITKNPVEDTSARNMASLRNIAANIMPRDGNTIVSTAGACVPNGLVAMPQSTELSDLSLIAPDSKAVILSFELLHRGAGRSGIDGLSLDVAGGRRRDVAGFEGEEARLSGDTAGNRGVRMIWVGGRQPSRSYSGTRITIELQKYNESPNSGPYDFSQLSKIWDVVLSGLEYRG